MQIILYLGKNVKEYNRLSQDEIRERFEAQHAKTPVKGHKPGCCQPGFTNCDAYDRHPKGTDGTRYTVTVYRVECRGCKHRVTVLPSFLLPYKHHDAYVVQNKLENVLGFEMTYRHVQAQELQPQSNGKPHPHPIRDPRTPWRWVQWLGRYRVAQVLRACGVRPPKYGTGDEKFLVQKGERIYALGLIENGPLLLWCLEYLTSTSQKAVKDKVATLYLDLGYDGHHRYLAGLTLDGWEPSQQAWRAVSPGTRIAECLRHPLQKLNQALATYRRQRQASEEEIKQLRKAFIAVLQAENQDQYLDCLHDLPEPFWQDELLIPRAESLRTKMTLLTQHCHDPHLARTSSRIDWAFKLLDRKTDSMQTFHTDESATATLRAWAIVRNFRRFLPGAKRQRHSPAELVGLHLQGIPWLQFINIKLSWMEATT